MRYPEPDRTWGDKDVELRPGYIRIAMRGDEFGEGELGGTGEGLGQTNGDSISG